MAGQDYYRTLRVPRDASNDEIKKAYRKLVFEHHPDRNPNSKEAEAAIREINAAYEVIGDPDTRKTYDRLRFGDEIITETPDLGWSSSTWRTSSLTRDEGTCLRS